MEEIGRLGDSEIAAVAKVCVLRLGSDAISLGELDEMTDRDPDLE